MNQASVIVLDIGVLLYDPEALYGFPKKEIVFEALIAAFSTLPVLATNPLGISIDKIFLEYF